MAHPCIACGGECYCHGDIDDCIVSKTPANCETCCAEFEEDQGWNDRDDYYDDLEDDDEGELLGYHCLGCGWTGTADPGGWGCPRCTGGSVEPYYG